MPKIKGIMKKPVKSKKNLVPNNILINKIHKNNNKKLKKFSNHIKQNNTNDLDVTVNSNEADFGNCNRIKVSSNKFSKLFRKNKAQRQNRVNTLGIEENVAIKLTSKFSPIEEPIPLKKKQKFNVTVTKPVVEYPTTVTKLFNDARVNFVTPNPVATKLNGKSVKLDTKALKIAAGPSNKSTKVLKTVNKQFGDKSKITKAPNRVSKRFKAKRSKLVTKTTAAANNNAVSSTTNSSNVESLVTHKIMNNSNRENKPINLEIITNVYRKTYENGWIVEDLNDPENHTENESSDSDRDSYLHQFFDNDDDMEESKTVKKTTTNRIIPPKSMLLLHHSPQSTENSDDLDEYSQPNFVAIKKRSKRKIEENCNNEIIPYVSIENADDDTTSDSNYDPSAECDLSSEYDPSSEYDTPSDDPYETRYSDNEYIEYSAEEVESLTDETSTEYESTNSEYTESGEDEFTNDCWSFDETYNSEDDEDYDPGINDDLYIRRGDAKIFDVYDNNISFNSDEGPQIFEIADMESQITLDNEICPDLVPINSVKNVSPNDPKLDLLPAVVNDILKDSENEEFNIEDDDDFLSNISAELRELVRMNISTTNSSDEDNHSHGKSKFYNSTVSTQLVLLHLKEILYFHGQFNVTLLHGSAKSFGYEFVLNQPIQFYSPSCDSLLFLMPFDTGKSKKLNTTTLLMLNEYFTQDIINEISMELAHSSEDAIMLLEYNESKRVESIQQYMRDTIFPSIESHSPRPFHLSEIRLNSKFIFPNTLDYSKYRKLEPETSWDKIQIHRNSKLMVIGGKNVGKSTLIKYLINSNINRLGKILLIDFDIGQPEIYTPQTISATVIYFPILGSGCLHKVQPKKILLFGDISVTSEQIKYIHACNMLIQYCTSNEELSAIPWVINTMGYNKGLGDEIIAAYLKTIKPTDVVQINSPRNADNFNQLFTCEFANQFQFNIFTQEFKDQMVVCNYNFIEIQAFLNMYDRNIKGLLSAKDKRLMMILAHLGDILDVYDTKWLSDACVKKIELNSLHIFTSYNLDKFGCSITILKEVLDMTFVYLCNKNNDKSTETTADCIGFGLVRHVDNEMGIIYLITAVSDDDLELVNALALTNVTIAKAILEKQSVLLHGNIKSIGLSNNFIGTRQVQPQNYRPDTTVNTRSNYVKE